MLIVVKYFPLQNIAFHITVSSLQGNRANLGPTPTLGNFSDGLIKVVNKNIEL